jgi:hypothetical protein
MKFIDKSHHLQLSIWNVLESASIRPLDADFTRLLASVDESIASLPMSEQLAAAGEAIARLGAIYRERCTLRLAQIDYLNHPEREPCLSLDAFDIYVRQTSIIDLEQFIESPELPQVERGYNRSEVLEIVTGAVAEREAEVALAEPVDPETAYQEAIGLAHDEDVSAWGAAISARLEEWGQPVSLLELQESIQMPLVQVWLALLLNGMTLEQRGEFYETERVWVLR